MDISMNAGVLIIGSLLWDEDEIRAIWRNTFLQTDAQISVSAPIRYGRISAERSNTFTMVFSTDCNDANKCGAGIFVPFRNNPINLGALALHRQQLIKSEHKKSSLDFDRNNWAWGALAIAINPNLLNKESEKYNQAQLLLAYWSKKYGGGFQPEDYSVGQEEPVVNKQGVLNFNWPDKLANFDFIIATATKPESASYPTSEDIANRMLVSGYSEYFRENVACGISTFQDQEITSFFPPIKSAIN